MDRTKEKVYLKRKLWKIFTLKRPQLLQKMLAVGVSLSLLLGAVPLGGQGVYVAAAGEPTKTVTALTPSDLDTIGNDKTKWKKNGDVYETQNQGSNSMACTMDVPVEVTAGYAELEFEWKVSSEAGSDYLRFELKYAGTGAVLHSNQKSGEDTAFDKFVLKLDKGTYTLTFTYQGDSSDSFGTDTGYVTNLNLVTYSGVSAISKTMFAERKDLIDPDNFSLATADYSKVSKISFGTRPGEVKYYKSDWSTEHSVDAGPITWLIAGSEKFTPEGGDETAGLVLYSEEPLVSANVAVYEYDEDSDSYPPPPGGADSRFQPSYFTDQSDGTSWVGPADEKASFTADWGSYTAGQEPDHVLANHWGASNLRKVLQQIYADDTAPYKGFFNATEKGLMSTSTIKTNDHQTDSAVEYTTTDVLYAPRYNSNQVLNSWANDDKITVGGSDSLSIDKAHWGGRSWLRSPNPKRSNVAHVALPGTYVSDSYVHRVNPAISAAFRLNLSSVLFASAASAASSAEGGKFEAISATTPMTLRLDGTASGKPLEGISTPTVEAGAITYTAPTTGARLMVLATGSDGATYQYFTDVTGTGSLALNDITSGLPAGMTYTARAWLETDVEDGGTLTYATKATEEVTCCTSYTIVPVSQLDATCTEPGHEAHYKCSVCGQLFRYATGTQPIGAPTQVAAKGHAWGDWKTTKEPTCTEAGSKTRTCKHDSSHPETEAIPATGHNSSGAWQKDETHHWKVCGTCSEKIENAEHTWDAGTVTTQPTTSAPGVKTYKCSVCGQTQIAPLPPLDAGTVPGGGDGANNGPIWGAPDLTVFDTFPQFINEAGRTSRVLQSGALDDRGILWLKETSDNTSAWYGLDLSTGAFDLDGLKTAFYVQWLNPGDDGYDEVFAQLDDAQKARVEADNGWIFLIGVEDHAGNKVQPSKPVSVYVQIGDDWDVDDLNAYYIAAGGDENVPVDYLMLDYPGGTDTFGRMTLSHFSPYFIFDELTDEEKAALTPKPNDNTNNQTTDKPNSSGTDLPGTGDLATQLLISALAIVLVSSLGVMLRLITSKKKFEE